MTYSFTQISHYLRCPRLYRYRYLDGWREKETRANALFSRCFEKALAACFLRQDSAYVWSKEWAAYREAKLEYSNGDSWDRMFHQGIQLLESFARHDRLRIRQPRRNLQLKLTKRLPDRNDFVAYVDAVGYLDGWVSFPRHYFTSIPCNLTISPVSISGQIRHFFMPLLNQTISDFR